MNGDYSINLNCLDFDRPFVCSETLDGGNNIYCCCTCGKFFKGRQENSPAFEHAIQTQDHLLFLNLISGLCFRLPEGEEVSSNELQELDVLRENLAPSNFSIGCAEELHDLRGSPYFRGFVPIWSPSSLLSCSILLIAHIMPLARQLTELTDVKSEKLQILANIMRKLWISRPLLRGRIVISSDLFPSKITCTNSIAHLINGLELDCLQGELRVSRVANNTSQMINQSMNFNQITVDLPPEPLFPDPSGKLPIPKIHLEELINQKYNSGKVFFDSSGNAVAYDLIFLPDYLLISILNRHKNKTVILFDPNCLSILNSSYYLIGNMATTDSSREDSYNVQIRKGRENNFLMFADRQFKPISTDNLILFDSCFQVWKKS